jgi:bifunctional DNase/RNase
LSEKVEKSVKIINFFIMKLFNLWRKRLLNRYWVFNFLVFAFSIFSFSFVIRSPCYDIEKSFFKSADAQDSELRDEDFSQSDKGEEFEVKVQGLVFDRISRAPVVILVTKDKERFVPIWIGFAEAMSIDVVLRGDNPPRPLTHDLFKATIEKLGAKVEKVKITTIKNNTYFAFIKFRHGNKIYYVDSRPSDAIALALRTGAPLYISKEILSASVRVPQAEGLLWSKLGISVQLITSDLEEFFKTKGVVVSDVRRNSKAEEKIKRGDIIISVNGKNTQNEKGIEILEDEVQKGDFLEIEILRDGKKQTLKISLK